MQEAAPTIKPGKPWTVDRARLGTKWVVNSLTRVGAELERASAQLKRIYAGRGHLALGHASWEEYVDAEFGELRERLTRSDISKLNLELTSGEGALSVRATAAVTGTSPATVSRDTQVSHDETPAPAPTVVGTDGKAYPRARATVIEEPTVTREVHVTVTSEPIAELLPAEDDEELEPASIGGPPDENVQRALAAVADIRSEVGTLKGLPRRALQEVITLEEWTMLTNWLVIALRSDAYTRISTDPDFTDLGVTRQLED